MNKLPFEGSYPLTQSLIVNVSALAGTFSIDILPLQPTYSKRGTRTFP